MWQYAVLVLWACATLIESTDEYREVRIAQGLVRGHLDSEGDVYEFYNVPYATAPTGRDKFKAPLPPPVWSDTFDAVDRLIACPQSSNIANRQEDCLVANIFVPDTNATNIPVLVYFHGGGYQRGFGNSDKLNTLVRTRRLIVITFNYRLAVNGFLCLGTEGAPGNAGAKDQVALLRWVQTNIASFGGNPDDVTIIGCSAGSGSVDALTLSGITTGLFKRAVIDSGVTLGAVGLQSDPIATAQYYATLLNFTNIYDIDALEEFYRTASFDLLHSQSHAFTANENGKILFSHCVERDIGEEMFFEDAPINIMKQGNYNKIPLLYGFTNMEGLMRIGNFNSWKDKMNENFADFLPGELYFESKETKAKVANTVKEFYFGDKPVSEETIEGYINYLTDSLFAYPMMKALSLRLGSLNDTVYLYEYSYVDENSPQIPHTDVKGATHCDQSRAILDQNKNSATAGYIQMKANMREYWLNFIWTGSPWVEGSELEYWPPVNADGAPYMSLGPIIQVKYELMKERYPFWDSIYEEYYRAPLPPTSSSVAILMSKFILTCGVFIYVLM